VKRLKLVWIDDQPRKIEAYRTALEAGATRLGYTASVEPIAVTQNVLDDLATWTERSENKPPHLFIVDQVFNAALPFHLSGASVAHLLRSAFPKTPIVCVTAKFDEPASFDQEDLSEYTALFLYNHLEDYLEDIYVIARDFPKLSPTKGNVREHLLKQLKAPKRDHESLLAILPEEFQSTRHATTEHRLARWIYSTLLRRPGFLYDRLHTATLLGLTEHGFGKVAYLFEKALYRGVFATRGKPRWWTSEVYRLLFSELDESGASIPQLAGRSLPGIEASDYSVCYVTKKADPPPDAVVMTDETGSAHPRTVRREFAVQHPRESAATPGFETRLILAKRRR
jgi:hypothetical protein